VPKTQRVLLVEDTEPLARVYIEFLRSEPYEVFHAATGKAALDQLAGGGFDGVVLDLKLPDMDGLDILRHIRAQQMPISVVIVTAHGSVSNAVEAMRQGAYDFIVKPFNADRLIVTLRNALERRELNELVDTYKQDFDRREFHGFVGASLPMQAVYRIIESAAPSNASVFITGLSGTGKELCAEAIHRSSPRHGKPFVAINCAAIPKDLVESEIFGHVKGAFTGAVAERDGAATQADGGTLFLDEVCEMPLALQATLLRFVQTGTFSRVGESKTRSVDVRFVCATNRDPYEEVRNGRLREDLYFRLHVIPVHLPPLRDRAEDIMTLAGHFVEEYAALEGKRFNGMSAEVEAIFMAYDWPGNVREMQNVLRTIVVLNNEETITAAMLPPMLTRDAPPATASPVTPSPAMADAPADAAPPLSDIAVAPMWKVEKALIDKALAMTDGNVPRAAALLEISPSTIYRKKQMWEEQGKDKTGSGSIEPTYGVRSIL